MIYRKDLERKLTSDEVDGNFKEVVDGEKDIVGKLLNVEPTFEFNDVISGENIHTFFDLNEVDSSCTVLVTVDAIATSNFGYMSGGILTYVYESDAWTNSNQSHETFNFNGGFSLTDKGYETNMFIALGCSPVEDYRVDLKVYVLNPADFTVPTEE